MPWGCSIDAGPFSLQAIDYVLGACTKKEIKSQQGLRSLILITKNVSLQDNLHMSSLTETPSREPQAIKDQFFVLSLFTPLNFELI